MKRIVSTITLSVLSICAILLVACGPNKEKQQEELSKEVIAVHDEVMPKMGELSKLRRELKDSINAWTSDSIADHSIQIQESTVLVTDLDSADKSMMNWMHEYTGGQGLYDHEEVMKYLNEEKVKITAVKEHMNKSMEAAKAYLKK